MARSDLDHFYSPRFFKQLDVVFDQDEGVLWLYMKPHGRGCFTNGLLRELKRYQQGLLKWEGKYLHEGELYPVKYQVLASGLSGVYNYGGDLELFLHAIADHDREVLLKYGVACIDVVYPSAINYSLPITTISLVCGDALGGGLEAALSSSIVIAEHGVQMGFPEIMFSLFPGMGAYNLLSRRLAPAQVKKIIASGNVYTAEEFYEMGVVDVLSEKGEGEDTVNRYIKRHRRHQNGHCAIDAVINKEIPVNYSDLYEIVEIWVDAAMNLGSKDLRVMERLAKAQGQRHELARPGNITKSHGHV